MLRGKCCKKKVVVQSGYRKEFDDGKGGNICPIYAECAKHYGIYVDWECPRDCCECVRFVVTRSCKETEAVSLVKRFLRKESTNILWRIREKC